MKLFYWENSRFSQIRKVLFCVSNLWKSSLLLEGKNRQVPHPVTEKRIGRKEIKRVSTDPGPKWYSIFRAVSTCTVTINIVMLQYLSDPRLT